MSNASTSVFADSKRFPKDGCMVGSTTSEVAIISGIFPYSEAFFITTWLCKNFFLSHLKGLSKSVDSRFKESPAQVLTGGLCFACGVGVFDQVRTPKVINTT